MIRTFGQPLFYQNKQWRLQSFLIWVPADIKIDKAVHSIHHQRSKWAKSILLMQPRNQSCLTLRLYWKLQRKGHYLAL
jgi:hypothetical protein